MKSFSLSPTDNNTIEMFSKDVVGRNKEIFQFLRLLEAIDGNCSIAIDSKWGSGKTFFVKQAKMILDCNNQHSSMSEENRTTLNKIQIKNDYKIENEKTYTTVYYDAWSNDNDEDPILSLMYEILRNDPTIIKLENELSFSETISSIFDVVTGRDVSNFVKNIKGNNPLESIKKTKDIHSLMQEFITALIEERGDKLVVFIDELDRCKPEYSVRLLERIKHYFNDDRIIFVFSVNLLELQHTIKSFYGNDFDATRYFDKFFDFSLSLSTINYDSYFRITSDFFDISEHYDIVAIEAVKYFHFSFREIERYIRLIKISGLNKPRGNAFKEEKGLDFAQNFIVPIMIALKMTNLSLYNDFVSGNDSKALLDILTNESIALPRSYFLVNNEYFPEENHLNDTAVSVIKEERIQKIYETIFSRNKRPNHRGVTIGQMTFSATIFEEISRVTTLISSISTYSIE